MVKVLSRSRFQLENISLECGAQNLCWRSRAIASSSGGLPLRKRLEADRYWTVFRRCVSIAARTIARLNSLSDANAGKRIQILIEEGANGRRLSDLVRLTGLPPERCKALIQENPELVFVEPAQRVVTPIWIEQMRRKAS